jgi:hypothetical protein
MNYLNMHGYIKTAAFKPDSMCENIVQKIDTCKAFPYMKIMISLTNN